MSGVDSIRTMAERTGGTVTEMPGSHAVYVSRPGVVADVIHRAVQHVASA